MTSLHALPGELQKIDVKIALDAPADFDWDLLLAVFGRWRLEPDEEILDVADYLHMPNGPGCLLVSHRWHFGVDFEGGVPGIFLSTRKGLKGELPDRFRGAIRLALEKARRLLSEPELASRVALRPSEIAVTVNDRMLIPDPVVGDEVVGPALAATLDRLFGPSTWTRKRDETPGARLGYKVRATTTGAVDELIARL